MTCPNCGAANNRSDNFCLRCGTRLTPEQPAAFGSPPPPTSGTIQPSPPPVYSAPPPAYGVPPPAWLPPPGLSPVTSSGNKGLAFAAVAGAVLLLILAGAALYLVTTGLHQNATAGTAATAQQQSEIVAAVAANNNAQIAALHNLDPNALQGTMSGPALAANLSMIQDLRTRGQYEDARLVKIDYDRATFTDPNHAVVHTVEQWEATLHSRDGTAASTPLPPQTLHETYYLVRQNGHWDVNQNDIQEAPAPTLGPGDQN